MKNIHEGEIDRETKKIDQAIKMLLIIILLAWCIMIILPFVVPVLWGIIMAVTLFPLYKRLLKLLKGKKTLSSTIITVIILIILIVPSVWLISSVVENARQIISSIRENTLEIPSPDTRVAEWPVIGKPIYNAWQMVATNIETAIVKYREQIIMAGQKFLGAIKSVTANLLMMVLSIIISGILLTSTEKSEKSTINLASRIAGKSGKEFITMIVITVRNVAKGILGVALIQFILLGTSFILADIPFAGLWALLVLLFAIVQLPVGIIAIPVVIYLYSSREPLPATLWSVMIVILSLSDNFLKPWLMGKGAPVPMLVIFIGAIGGMILSGFIGLFTGAIILSLGYKLVTVWLGGESAELNDGVTGITGNEPAVEKE